MASIWPCTHHVHIHVIVWHISKKLPFSEYILLWGQLSFFPNALYSNSKDPIWQIIQHCPWSFDDQDFSTLFNWGKSGNWVDWEWVNTDDCFWKKTINRLCWIYPKRFKAVFSCVLYLFSISIRCVNLSVPSMRHLNVFSLLMKKSNANSLQMRFLKGKNNDVNLNQSSHLEIYVKDHCANYS